MYTFIRHKHLLGIGLENKKLLILKSTIATILAYLKGITINIHLKKNEKVMRKIYFCSLLDQKYLSKAMFL